MTVSSTIIVKCQHTKSILTFIEHYFEYILMIPLPYFFSLQFRVRCCFTAEGGGEKTVQTFSVSHPLSTLVPGAEAAQAHETRERSCWRYRLLADRQTDAVIDRLPLSLQVIGLLDVFTPAAALEDFSEL